VIVTADVGALGAETNGELLRIEPVGHGVRAIGIAGGLTGLPCRAPDCDRVFRPSRWRRGRPRVAGRGR